MQPNQAHPLTRGCALPIFFIAVGRCRVGDGESIAGEEVGESTPTTPECFHSGKAISFSAEEASQAGALADRRDQIRRLSGKWCARIHGQVQHAPLVRSKDAGAAGRGLAACFVGHPQHMPGDDRQRGQQSLGAGVWPVDAARCPNRF